MKKFLHKKWLSIPVIVVLVLALTAGSVLAAGYNFWSATAEVTIEEPMEVTLAAANANIVFEGNDLTVSFYAGSQVKAGWDITNIGRGQPITIMPSITPSSTDGGHITTVWKDGPGPGANVILSPGLPLAPGDTQRFGLTIKAAGIYVHTPCIANPRAITISFVYHNP